MATIDTTTKAKAALLLSRDLLIAALKARSAAWAGLPGPEKVSALAHYLPSDSEVADFKSALDAAFP